MGSNGNPIAEVFRLSLKHRCPFHIVHHPDVFIVPKVVLGIFTHGSLIFEVKTEIVLASP